MDKLRIFLGTNQNKRYLLVFQNNAEMRASGGFIGSFALVDLAGGKIKNIETSLHTYFGDAGPIINYLINLPVDCIGIDATETRLEDVLKNDFSKKELAIGLINARESYIEDVDELVSKLKLIKNRSRPKALWLTPNTGTEYIGWTYGLKKMNILKKAVEAFKNE